MTLDKPDLHVVRSLRTEGLRYRLVEDLPARTSKSPMPTAT